MCSEVTSEGDATVSNLSQDYGRLVYTHKTHEKEAERKIRQSLWLTWANLIVVSTTLAATIAMPLLEDTWAQWVPVASAVIAFGFGTAQLSFQPQREAAEHRSAAKAFLNLRDDFARLIADWRENPNAPELRSRRDGLRPAEWCTSRT
ncbi:SLATT domain-containing protein [Mycobacterium sp. ZZG]